MTYTALQALVADYLHRTDLTSKLPTFISLAEASLFREVDAQALEVSVTGTTTGAYAALPDDFDSLSKLSIPYGDREWTLDYQQGNDDLTMTIPTGYSYEGNQLRLWGAGDGQAYTLYYKAKLVPLSDAVASNWLLDNALDLYLYASALEGAKYIKDDGAVAQLGTMVSGAMASFKSKQARRHLPMAGGLRIRPRF